MDQEKNNNYLVSVIIPVYNCENYLSSCIESVMSQSYKNIELILVDDGSTDQSTKMCDELSKSDNRIKTIHQQNSGPAAARNRGIDMASGEYIFFLDSDDIIDRESIEILVDAYREHNPDLVMSNFNKLEHNGQYIEQKVSFDTDNIAFTGQTKELNNRDMVGFVRHFLKYPSNHLISYCWARLYKTSIIKKTKLRANADMRLFEDFVFNLDYLQNVNKTIFVNRSLYTYCLHSGHISASMSIVNAKSLLHDMTIFRSKTSDYLQSADIKNSEKEIGHTLVHYAIIFIIRTCRQITKETKKRIYTEIKKLITSPILRDGLQHYASSRGNSKLMPILMRLKQINLLMYFCKRRANKRYGKLSK